MITFYEVGGSIRDELLGLKNKDLDFAVECESYSAMKEAILARGGKIFVETPEHFTIRANVPNLGACDYVVTRKEGPYSDGRRPDWVKVGNIWDDLARRDFSMNAIARNVETGELLDPHGGRADIARRLIVAVGDVKQRMTEDKLRAFRAVRFAVTKGFEIAGTVRDAINTLPSDAFEYVASDRIKVELDKMLRANTTLAIQLLYNEYPNLWQVIIDKNIWFKPTTESR